MTSYNRSVGAYLFNIKQAELAARKESRDRDEEKSRNIFDQMMQQQKHGEDKKQKEFDRQMELARLEAEVEGQLGHKVPEWKSDELNMAARIGAGAGSYKNQEAEAGRDIRKSLEQMRWEQRGELASQAQGAREHLEGTIKPRAALELFQGQAPIRQATEAAKQGDIYQRQSALAQERSELSKSVATHISGLNWRNTPQGAMLLSGASMMAGMDPLSPMYEELYSVLGPWMENYKKYAEQGDEAGIQGAINNPPPGAIEVIQRFQGSSSGPAKSNSANDIRAKMGLPPKR